MSSLICRCGHAWSVPAAYFNGPLACPACGASVGLPAAETATVPPAPADAGAVTLPPSEPTPAPGANIVLPGYEIIRELGRGGMGVVYQARHQKLHRLVALKMILAGSHAGAADLARFQTEAEAIARLQHPNIVQVYEVGEHEGKPFFALEFCGGGSLEKKLAGTPLPPKDAAALVETLARAMQAAHEKGVIHRDLKPANVLLADDGTPKITDFGLAKKLDEAGQTASGAIMGTPSYMAPEQAGMASPGRKPGESAVGPAADVYALGAILYECLTGRPPFKTATAVDTIMQVVMDEPVPPRQFAPGVEPDLETVCLKCLAKHPNDRYLSAAALAEDLRRFLDGDRPVHARPLGEWASAVRWAKRRPIVAVLTGLFLIGTILLQLVCAAICFVGVGMPALALAAWPAGFLTTMAILVRPRRWVVSGAVLFLFVTLGLPMLVFEMLTKLYGTGGVPLVWGVPHFLLVALGLGVGIAYAGVFGGMSRWIARRHQHDMLTVFFSGLLGVMCAAPLPCCVGFFGQFASELGPNGIGLVRVLSIVEVLLLIACLAGGFWLGGHFIPRFLQRQYRAG